MDIKEIVLVGGAPRSGTTLMANLLDSHQDILVFPVEHSSIEKSFQYKDNPDYFITEFISNRFQGQQALLANSYYLQGKFKKWKEEYGKDFSFDIDPNKFKAGYLAYLEGVGDKAVSLKIILNALGYALAASNSYAQGKYRKVKYLVFKQPFFTETYAQRIFKIDSSFLFIQINRDPIKRYISAKARRLSSLNGARLKYLLMKNRTLGNFAAFGALEISIGSFFLSIENRTVIGDRYRSIDFEDLMNKRDLTIFDIISWLGLERMESIIPTRLGVPTKAGSTLVKTDINGKVIKTENKKLISSNELIFLNYIIKKVPYLSKYASERPSIFKMLINYMKPFYKESFMAYVFRLFQLPKILLFDYTNYETRIHDKIVTGNKVSISGNT